MLWKRVATALVAVPVVLPLFIYGGELANFLFWLVVMQIGLLEYYTMAFPDDAVDRRAGVVLGLGLFAGWGSAIVFDAAPLAFHAVFLAAVLLMFLYFLFHTGDMATVGPRIAKGMLGLVYIDLLGIYLVALYALPETWKYILLLLVTVWACDTGAYFAGRFLGKRKLYEKVSPKKTWAGAVGGTLASIAAAVAFRSATGMDFPLVHLLIVAFLMAAIGQMGDLCESLLKRSFGIKDSGQIIPGHGGVLDRFDAVLFAAPILYYYAIALAL